MSLSAEEYRPFVDNALEVFNLKLDGLTVLTEAASGNFVLTPLIAALAGAKNVFCLSRDSRFASLDEVVRQTMSLAQKWDIEDKIEIFTDRTDSRIGQADIVTNLGFVRPLDAPLLSQLKSTAVIPLMWETWEFRPDELDLDYCRTHDLAVLGTNEAIPELRTQDFIGPLAEKLLGKMDIDARHDPLLIVGTGNFARQTLKHFCDIQANVILVDLENTPEWPEAVRNALPEVSAAVFVDPLGTEWIISPEGAVTPEEVAKLAPSLALAHISGGVCREELVNLGLRCWPEQFTPPGPGRMSVTTDYFSPKPMVDLHTAGLKVGELMARARLGGLDRRTAEREALKHPVAQDFPESLRG